MIRKRGFRCLVAVPLAAWTAVAAMPAAHSDPTGAQSELTAVSGQGTGVVIVSPTSAPDATFVAQVKVVINHAAPNTKFTVTRAAEGPADGVCTSTAFAPVATLTTSAGGAGAVEFNRTGPALNFDLVLRVIGDDGSVLQSECMVIIGK